MDFRQITIRTLLLLPALLSCERQIPSLSLGLNDEYSLPRMQTYRFEPGFSGEGYRWILRRTVEGDSLLSSERFYTFVQQHEGSYDLTFEVVDPAIPYRHDFRVQVVREQVEYSPYITKVLDYCPAPGQFVNEMPRYEPGDTPETMRRKVEENISGRNDVMVTLGAFGGYLTFGFDHTVMNVSGQNDFVVYGNAFYSLVDVGRLGGSCEPGVVMVAFDTNCNGKPDDEEWYELAGSEYQKPETWKEYSVEYHRPDRNKQPEPDLTGNLTDTSYIAWSDNRGSNGFIPKNRFHSQEYYPRWVENNSITFTGTRLPPNGEDISGMGSYWMLYASEWGYVDNHPNDSIRLVGFDIDWAVDRIGQPVHLPGIDFVRVYTGVNQSCGWMGETSTEIVRARDLHIEESQPSVPDPLPDNEVKSPALFTIKQ